MNNAITKDAAATEGYAPAAGSALAWDSMDNCSKLALLAQALLAVGARMWTEAWEQSDWPHELSTWAERNAISRLTANEKAQQPRERQ